MNDTLKKIVLVGPVFPYKGGISHYTSLLYKEISKKYEVAMVSYKLQYPKILFKREQKDYSNDYLKIPETEYWINTANPFNWLVSAAKIKKEKPDLVIIQWWHPYFTPCYWTLSQLMGRTKILFVCHNVFPHERFLLDKFCARITLKRGDYYIVHSKTDVEDLKSIKKDPLFCQTVLPTFNLFKQKGLSGEESRMLLGLGQNTPVLLFFGFVRKYKGLQHLIKAMPIVKNHLPGVKLLIVGDFDGDKDQYLELINQCDILEIIEIHDGYIPDQDVEKFFVACDLVVLPYESATQSGIVQIAYGFDKPVIATSVGGLPEVVRNGETGYLVEAENPVDLADKILMFFESVSNIDFSLNIKKEEYKYSWERLTGIIEALYEGTRDE